MTIFLSDNISYWQYFLLTIFLICPEGSVNSDVGGLLVFAELLNLGFPLSLELLLHGLHTALDLLDALLGLGDEVLLVIQLGGQLGVVLVLVANNHLQVPLASLKVGNSVLGYLEVTLNLPLLLLQSGPGLLLLIQTFLQLSQSGLQLLQRELVLTLG